MDLPSNNKKFVLYEKISSYQEEENNRRGSPVAATPPLGKIRPDIAVIVKPIM